MKTIRRGAEVSLAGILYYIKCDFWISNPKGIDVGNFLQIKYNVFPFDHDRIPLTSAISKAKHLLTPSFWHVPLGPSTDPPAFLPQQGRCQVPLPTGAVPSARRDGSESPPQALLSGFFQDADDRGEWRKTTKPGSALVL